MFNTGKGMMSIQAYAACMPGGCNCATCSCYTPCSCSQKSLEFANRSMEEINKARSGVDYNGFTAAYMVEVNLYMAG